MNRLVSNHQTLFSGPIKGKVQNQRIRLKNKRKRKKTPKVKANKKKRNHQTPKVKANKKKRNHKTPKVKANKKKSNSQRPRFRFDKNKSNLQTPNRKKFWSNKRGTKCQNNDKYCHLFQESSQLLNKVTNFLKNVITKLQNSRPIKEKVKNNPRFRVDKKKSYPRFRASNRNFNHQIPRFRADKRKSYHQTLRFMPHTTESKCKNNKEHCEQWSKHGDCDHKVYGPYMKKYCKLSCNLCTANF